MKLIVQPFHSGSFDKVKKYRVTLTTEERAMLGDLVSVGKAAARKITHARILLLADEHSEAG